MNDVLLAKSLQYNVIRLTHTWNTSSPPPTENWLWNKIENFSSVTVCCKHKWHHKPRISIWHTPTITNFITSSAYQLLGFVTENALIYFTNQNVTVNGKINCDQQTSFPFFSARRICFNAWQQTNNTCDQSCLSFPTRWTNATEKKETDGISDVMSSNHWSTSNTPAISDNWRQNNFW